MRSHWINTLLYSRNFKTGRASNVLSSGLLIYVQKHKHKISVYTSKTHQLDATPYAKNILHRHQRDNNRLGKLVICMGEKHEKFRSLVDEKKDVYSFAF
jgi:hypothetical protein